MARVSKADMVDAIERLQKYLPLVPNTRRANGTRDYGVCHRPTIYQLVRHVSKSGMSRDISTFAVENGQLVCLDWAIGTVVGGLRRDAVRISGCGMDMGFALLEHACHKAWSHLPYEQQPSANDYDRRWL